MGIWCDRCTKCGHPRVSSDPQTAGRIGRHRDRDPTLPERHTYLHSACTSQLCCECSAVAAVADYIYDRMREDCLSLVKSYRAMEKVTERWDSNHEGNRWKGVTHEEGKPLIKALVIWMRVAWIATQV